MPADKSYRRNHYVPKWYQERFLPDTIKERKFYYLDLNPDSIKLPHGRIKKRADLLRWGPSECFKQDDLYTTQFAGIQSTEIEQKFFGKIDRQGLKAVDYITNFTHKNMQHDTIHDLLSYMSIQKLRTPKGLKFLAHASGRYSKNAVLFLMQQMREMYCAIWTECIWSIADASQAETKFILSDHPVTVYNADCFPLSKWCRDFLDPDIRFKGSHTIFPLSLDKILILTNLSWVRNPYANGIRLRPNPNFFRPSVFNFLDIQINRTLSDIEVNEINFVIKNRAHRYIAAAKKEWLYPEKLIPTDHWRKLGKGYLFMPDPRSVSFGGEIIIGYDDGRAVGFDEYGRRPWQEGYKDTAQHDKEWKSFHAFKGEYARIFGPQRRGQSYNVRLDCEEDDADYHQYHLSLEKEYGAFKRRR